MAFDVLPGLGQPLRRLEDPRLLTGGGRFTADRSAPGALQAVFLRSPHAHARIQAVDAAAARAMPGVAAIFTAADTAGLGHNPALTEIHDAAGRRHVEPPRLPIAPTACAMSARSWRWWSPRLSNRPATQPRQSRWTTTPSPP